MRRSLRWMLGVFGGAATLGSGGGCAIGLDLFSDDFFSNFGLDVSSLRAPSGRSIVNFRNETAFPVTFNYIFGVDPNDLTAGVDGFNVLVNAGEARNQVFDCRTEFVDLGTVDDAFAFAPLAAVVTVGDGATEVAYAGARLVNGEEFFCGNVIDVAIDEAPVAGANAAAFNITVRIIRGR